MSPAATNWARNITFRATEVRRPTSVEQLQEIVAAADRLRALGTGHSFNAVADTTGTHVSTAALPADVTIEPMRSTARVSGGMTYGAVARALHTEGWALRNMGSLPHISVAGACATGTHGSGRTLGCLASGVSVVELVRPDGSLATVRRGADGFAGSVVALGCLGVVTRLTLDVVPAFDVRQVVYDGLAHDTWYENFDAVMDGGYSVSVFTRWAGRVAQVWRKERVDVATGPPEPTWFGATAADGPRHPVPEMDVASSTEQLGVPGPWFERLPHFRVDFTPSSGDELQTEYLVDRRDGAAACATVDRVRDRVAPALQVSEIRTVAADDLWLSPATGRDSVALHFTWYDDAAAVRDAIAVVESALEPFDARPHWGKLFGLPPDVVADRYPRLADFRRLREAADPTGKLGNDLVDKYLGAVGGRR